MMNTRRAAATVSALLTAGLVGGGLVSPAYAAVDFARDRVGDASSARNEKPMDITRVFVDNRDRQVVVRVDFDKPAFGSLIVSVDPRGGEGVRLISQHRRASADQPDEDFVLPHAFTDTASDDPSNDEPVATDCPRFRVAWNDRSTQARMVLPSTCLNGGDFGAIRYAVLTETPRNGDSDFAHAGRASNTDWVRRG